MISVGYGDISPKTNPERLFCVLNMLISCAVFGKKKKKKLNKVRKKYFKLFFLNLKYISKYIGFFLNSIGNII
jgi:hypothetical protein